MSSRRAGAGRGGAAGRGAARRSRAAAVAARAAEPRRRSKGQTGGKSRSRAGAVAAPQGGDDIVVELPRRKQILVSSEASELRVAVVEDGRLAEILIERPSKTSCLGNIYKGKVDNVLAGMDAAFVDFGLDKNGFLSVDEVVVEDEPDRRGRRITQMLHPDQEILVQVSKDPMGNKGARLTTKLSLAGRYLVYVPNGSGVGVSRRLKQDERDRLRDLGKSLDARNAGLIARTAAEGTGIEELRRDLHYPVAAVGAAEEEGRQRDGAGARVRRGRRGAGDRARPVQRVVRERRLRHGEAPEGDRRLPGQGGARAEGARGAVQRARAAVRGLRHRGADLARPRTAGEPAQRRQPGHRPHRGADRDRREHAAATPAARASRTRPPRRTSRRRARSSVSCGCETSAASSSSTSSTWRAPRTARRC